MTVTGIIEVPDAAVQAVAESLMFEYESEHALPEGATWRSWEGRARELLALAAPHFREAFGQEAATAQGILTAVAYGHIAVQGVGDDGEPVFRMTDQGKAYVEGMTR